MLRRSGSAAWKKYLRVAVTLSFMILHVHAAREDFMVGVDANYSLDMENQGARWKWDLSPTKANDVGSVIS
jgi:arabinogalactan endo-1,4-beta-galactosidase